MSYPYYNSSDFEKRILDKAEFRDHFNTKNSFLEPIQYFLRNYINPDTPYDRLLVYHNVGAGKTLSAITIAENFRSRFSVINKKIIILVKNQILAKNFKDELNLYFSFVGKEDSNQLNIYKFMTFGTFANSVLGFRSELGELKYGDEGMMTDLSDSIIIVDEVHNILKNRTGEALIKILKNSVNTRLIMLSATPIFDSVNLELESLVKLLCSPQDINISDNLFIQNKKITKYFNNFSLYNFNENFLENLKTLIKGKITYFDINVKNIPSITKNVFVKCFMSDTQYEIYKSKDNKTNFDEDTINLDIPDTETSGSYNELSIISNSSTPVFSSKADVSKHSCKIQKMVEKIKESEGKVFVYSFYIPRGIELIEKALLLNGINSFRSIKGDTTKQDRDNIMSTFNSVSNLNGEKIKILIASNVLSQGVSLKAIREIHILEPTWNEQGLQQIIGRGIRNFSHDQLPESKRNISIYKYIAKAPQGIDEPLIDEAKYVLAKEKNKSISKLLNFFQQNSFHCSITNSENCENIKEIKPEFKDISTFNPSFHTIYQQRIVARRIKTYLSEYEVIQIKNLKNDIINEFKITSETFDYILFTILDSKDILVKNDDTYDIKLKDKYLFITLKYKNIQTTIDPLDDINVNVKINENTQIKKEHKKTIVILDKTGIWGTYSDKHGINDNKFRIIDFKQGNTDGLTADIRKKTFGQVCSTLHKDEIKKMINKLYEELQIEDKIDLNNKNIQDTDYPKLLKLLDIDKLEQLSSTKKVAIKRELLCKIAEKLLIKNQRIL